MEPGKETNEAFNFKQYYGCSKLNMQYYGYVWQEDVVYVPDSEILSDIDIPNLIFCNEPTIKNSLFYYNAEAKQISMWLERKKIPKDQNFSQWNQKVSLLFDLEGKKVQIV
uniref:Uncharacterized protein n=1 Tax=Romanomermis culicivorax TaxID=13658 RepID=A0A915K8Y7_ROMCU